MCRALQLSSILLSGLSLAACALDDNDAREASRDRGVELLAERAGAPISLERADAGTVRVLATTPWFSLPGRASHPVDAARAFVKTNHALLQLTDVDADDFTVTRVDHDTAGDIHHVTLQRTYQGIDVFQGALTVHMDSGNNIFRVLGDESYQVTRPSNQRLLDTTEAAHAAARALGVRITPVLTASTDRSAEYSSPGLLEPIYVDQKIVHLAPGDDRFAYQVTLAWNDEAGQQQYELALIDAGDGSLIGGDTLVDTFTGRVFHAGAQPTANMTTDRRTVVSFNGNATASPSGWVGTARRTSGNNAVAATDLNRDNVVGTNETQPTASTTDAFDFPFSPTQNASGFRAAAVTNAFFLVNDYHDRTYLLGFTEASGNFQLSNFGKGGAQADEVQVDAQDGSGTNNANFATPVDGRRPRMQMFLFTSNGGAQEDGDFDPTVIYHENSHGISNRLVGGGSTTCLRGTQSGGMGEGWGDWFAASFLNNPVIGAYVTGNATRGIRRASMAASPFTYGNIKDGTMTEVHDAGEIWAATLWDVRTAVGAAVAEQLVVSGMKLTPCNPTMLQARDGIIQADQNINAGANRCRLFRAFAGRLMGSGASSPNHNSTTAIVTSTAVPAGC